MSNFLIQYCEDSLDCPSSFCDIEQNICKNCDHVCFTTTDDIEHCRDFCNACPHGYDQVEDMCIFNYEEYDQQYDYEKVNLTYRISCIILIALLVTYLVSYLVKKNKRENSKLILTQQEQNDQEGLLLSPIQ